MPLLDAKPDALARVYANSLFELAEAAGGGALAETIQGQLEDVLELARSDSAFSEFLASRVVSAEARGAALRRILEGHVDDLTLRFLLLLNQKGRLGHLPAIAAALDQAVQAKFGRVEVDVFTASPIGADELGRIRARLQQALGKEAIVHPYTDASMIGGLKLRIGDRLIDGSVAARLRQMRDRMNREGSAELRGRFGRIIDAG